MSIYHFTCSLFVMQRIHTLAVAACICCLLLPGCTSDTGFTSVDDDAGSSEPNPASSSDTHPTQSIASPEDSERENERIIDTESETEDDQPTVLCDGGGTGPGHYLRWMEFDGRLRNYHLHVPAGYDSVQPVPLVFDLHAHPTTAAIEDLLSGFRKKADREGFVVVQPNGVAMGWNSGPKCCGEAAKQKVDDVGFIRAIRDAVSEELCLDLKRVYVDGMSSGGYLAHRIGCEASDLVAAIGPVASAIGFASLEECQPSRPVPVAMISGTADEFPEKQATFERWHAINGCSQFYEEEHKGIFSCRRYKDCANGAETIHCIGEGVEHCWPGTASSAVSVVYPCTDDLITTDFLWEFFSHHHIP